ncbi:MAG: hypothetical protein IT162_18545 [Bryobacterales bacterium]|nr:hypothetical protein [Bryobacterales bacterium]
METDPPAFPALPPVPSASFDEQEPMLYCPVCSLRLSAHQCKLRCDRCGYYMSCADYY